MKKAVPILLWILAFILTVTVAVYQRLTGPTHPVRGTETVNGTEIKYRLLRSYTQFEKLPVEITAANPQVKGFLNWRRYKSGDEWTEMEMTRTGEILKGEIPGQPAAGKVEYSIRVENGGENLILNEERSVVARFKGKVPVYFLIIHIIFMFAGLLFAFRTGLETLRKAGNYSWMVTWTLGIVFIGGMILGPIVQEYAFGDFWTGFPYGTDLTDNKTLIAVIFWVLAYFLQKKSKWWVLLATVMMIVVYLIPHSAMGSELDYTSGKMKNKYGYHISFPQPGSSDGREVDFKGGALPYFAGHIEPAAVLLDGAVNERQT